jgi:hypothetical protein
MKTGIETHLVIRIAKDPRVCTNCNHRINVGEAFHLEEGVKEHLHSLVARHFCTNCYTRFGEIQLLSKK